MSSDPTLATSLRAAERRPVAAQLPSLGLVVTAGAIVWAALTALTARRRCRIVYRSPMPEQYLPSP